VCSSDLVGPYYDEAFGIPGHTPAQDWVP
jgi:hypothetical protein